MSSLLLKALIQNDKKRESLIKKRDELASEIDALEKTLAYSHTRLQSFEQKISVCEFISDKLRSGETFAPKPEPSVHNLLDDALKQLESRSSNPNDPILGLAKQLLASTNNSSATSATSPKEESAFSAESFFGEITGSSPESQPSCAEPKASSSAEPLDMQFLGQIMNAVLPVAMDRIPLIETTQSREATETALTNGISSGKSIEELQRSFVASKLENISNTLSSNGNTDPMQNMMSSVVGAMLGNDDILKGIAGIFGNPNVLSSISQLPPLQPPGPVRPPPEVHSVSSEEDDEFDEVLSVPPSDDEEEKIKSPE